MNKTITFETYPDSYEKRDNKEYQYEMIVFTVSVSWAKDFIRDKWNISIEEFKDRYTWDESLILYDHALLEFAILDEKLEGR